MTYKPGGFTKKEELLWDITQAFKNLIPAPAPPSYDIDVDTADVLATVEDRIYGNTTFDLSVDFSIAGNTALFNNVADLNAKFLLWPSGQVMLWSYFFQVGGDGWNSRELDATLRNIDYQTEQDGELWNGGNPYGRDFYVEALELIVAAGVTNIGIGVNLASPLCPFSDQAINWDTIDIGSVCDQIAVAVQMAEDAGLNVYIFEAGMELPVGRQADLVNKTGKIINPSDPEEGGAVIARLMTWTNATSPVSILDTMRTLCPTAFVSIDSKQWDNNNNKYPNWNAQVSAIPVDGLRQYFQFEAQYLVSYESGREHIANDVPVFMGVIQGSNFNGKRVFVSQVAFKFNNPVLGKFANGLLLAEVMMELARASALADNILKGVSHQSIVAMVDQPDDFAPTVVFECSKVFSGLFLDNADIVPVTFSDPDITDNCVILAFATASEVRIGILNPTENTYQLSGALAIDGVDKPYTATQIFSPTLNVYDENYTVVVEADTFNLRPYGMTVVVIPL